MVASSTTHQGESPVRRTRTGRFEPGTEGLSGVKVPTGGLCATSFELVLNEPGDGEDFESLPEPIATLYEEGGHSRAVLARVTMGQGCVLEHLTLKIQKNRYSMENAPASSPGATNPAVEDLWRREYENLKNLDASTNAVPRLIDLSADGGDESRLTRWPPLLLCKDQRVLFSTRCSRCGHILSDCRDDALLAEHDLPTYSASTHRFLYCRRCVEEGGEPRFYAYTVPQDVPSGQVGGWEELCSDLAATLRERERLAEEDPELYRVLSDGVPCYTCPESPDCLEEGSGDAAEIALKNRLVPVSFYETFVICTELFHFHYDEFCDLLGGQPMEEIRDRFALSESNRGQAVRLGAAQRIVRDKGMLLFEADGSGLDALEVFRLKLSMFAQLCSGIYELHRRCGQPHLCIEPSNVLVQLTEVGEHLPTMWNFQVKLTGLSSTAPLTIDGKPSAELCFPPDSPSIIYTAPVIRQGLFGRTQVGDFVLAEVTVTGDAEDGCRVRFEGELTSENVFSQTLSLKDSVYLVLPGSSFGADDVALWCRQADAASTKESGLRLQSEPCLINKEVVQSMKDARGIRIPSVRYVIYPCFHVPCDLHSLGMMLFRTLLVNDEQELAQVEMALEGVRNRLPELALESFEQDEGRTLEIIMTELREKQNVDVFDKGNALYRSVDRLEGRPNAIPDTLWYDALLLGLRLVTAYKGFSICADHGDFDSRYPAEKLEPVLETLETLIRKASGILFSRTKHSVEVREVIDEIVEEPFNGSSATSETRA